VPALGPRHPAVQQLRRLARRRSARLASGTFVIDGPVLVGDALDAGLALTEAFVDVDAADERVAAVAARLRADGVPVRELAAGVLASAVDTVTPHGLAAVAHRPAPVDPAADPRAERSPAAAPFVLVLAGVGDPGNAGTLLRTAEAAGVTAVVAAAGSVDLFGPKTVRSSAGSLFRLPVAEGAAPGPTREALTAAGVTVLGTRAEGGTPYDRADLRRPLALVLGSEAHGVGPEWAALVDEWVMIPMAGGAESLNVAMAGTVVCFEAARQRRGDE
jgi:TrmH family RNA methyltransferase